MFHNYRSIEGRDGGVSQPWAGPGERIRTSFNTVSCNPDERRAKLVNIVTQRLDGLCLQLQGNDANVRARVEDIFIPIARHRAEPVTGTLVICKGGKESLRLYLTYDFENAQGDDVSLQAVKGRSGLRNIHVDPDRLIETICSHGIRLTGPFSQGLSPGHE